MPSQYCDECKETTRHTVGYCRDGDDLQETLTCTVCGTTTKSWHITALVHQHWAVIEPCGLPQETIIAVLCTVHDRQIARTFACLGFQPEQANNSDVAPGFSRPSDPTGRMGAVVERLRACYYWTKGKPVVGSLTLWAAYDRFLFNHALKGGSVEKQEEVIVRLFLSALN